MRSPNGYSGNFKSYSSLLNIKLWVETCKKLTHKQTHLGFPTHSANAVKSKGSVFIKCTDRNFVD